MFNKLKIATASVLLATACIFPAAAAETAESTEAVKNIIAERKNGRYELNIGSSTLFAFDDIEAGVKYVSDVSLDNRSKFPVTLFLTDVKETSGDDMVFSQSILTVFDGDKALYDGPIKDAEFTTNIPDLSGKTLQFVYELNENKNLNNSIVGRSMNAEFSFTAGFDIPSVKAEGYKFPDKTKGPGLSSVKASPSEITGITVPASAVIEAPAESSTESTAPALVIKKDDNNVKASEVNIVFEDDASKSKIYVLLQDNRAKMLLVLAAIAGGFIIGITASAVFHTFNKKNRSRK